MNRDIHVLLDDTRRRLSDEPLTLIDAELDWPDTYLFESDSWVETVGAGRQLMALRTAFSAALSAGGVPLRAEAGRLIALLPGIAAENDHWRDTLSHIAATASGGLLTCSIGLVELVDRQVFGGLYSAPERVIGIPGMTDHQARINRYYGVDNPSTVPSPERIAARRHFGEGLSLAAQFKQRDQDERLIWPFTESLPLFELCCACHDRPAETQTNGHCGICARKRQAADRLSGDLAAHYALIGAYAPNAERFLLSQPTPGAYQRAANALRDGWQRAIRDAEKAKAITLWQSGAVAWLIAPPTSALIAAARMCSAFEAANTGLVPGKPTIAVGIAFGHGNSNGNSVGAQTLYGPAQAALGSAIVGAARDLEGSALQLTFVGRNFADGLRYTPETLGRLHAAAELLVANGFPNGFLADLPLAELNSSTQAAGLYFDHARSRLADSHRAHLDTITREFQNVWGVGTVRFFRALGDLTAIHSQLVTERAP